MLAGLICFQKLIQPETSQFALYTLPKTKPTNKIAAFYAF